MLGTLVMLFPRQHDMSLSSEFHRHVVENLNFTHHHLHIQQLELPALHLTFRRLCYPSHQLSITR